MTSSFEISFDSLRQTSDENLPLEELSDEEHIHGGLYIHVHGRLLPHMSHFGLTDVCFDTWTVELESVYQTFLAANDGEHIFDEREQGQPKYVFKRNGDSAFVTIAESLDGGGSADPGWQNVEFAVSDFFQSYRQFREEFVAALQQAAPLHASEWITGHLPDSYWPYLGEPGQESPSVFPTQTTSDGISSTDWAKVQRLAEDVVNAPETADDQKLISPRRRLLQYLDILEKKYGKLPSILATRADYLDDLTVRIQTLTEAYTLAKTANDLANCTWIGESIASLHIDIAEDFSAGRLWLDKLADALANHWADFEHNEYLRLTAKLDQNS